MIRIERRPFASSLTTASGVFEEMFRFQVQEHWLVRANIEIFSKQQNRDDTAGQWILSGILGHNSAKALVVGNASTNAFKAGTGTALWDTRVRIVGTDSIVIEVLGSAGVAVDWDLGGWWDAIYQL